MIIDRRRCGGEGLMPICPLTHRQNDARAVGVANEGQVWESRKKYVRFGWRMRVESDAAGRGVIAGDFTRNEIEVWVDVPIKLEESVSRY